MIDVEELRIGNHVIIADSVTYISDNIVFDYDEGSWYVDDRHITLVKQIPLTEKWLLDFGFKKIEYGCSFEYEIKLDRFSRLTIQDDFSFGLTNLNDDRDLLCFENDIIKSVHRLQNLYFALTGKNLKL